MTQIRIAIENLRYWIAWHLPCPSWTMEFGLDQHRDHEARLAKIGKR